MGRTRNRGFLVATVSTMSLCAGGLQVAEAAEPIKHYIMIDLGEATDVLVLDRWYLNHHAPETLQRTRRAQTRYVSYRTYAQSSEERARFRAVTGRMTEIGFDSLATFRAGFTPEARARVTMTPTPPELGDAMEVISVTIGDQPDIFVKEGAAEERSKPYFRWILFVDYPEDADAAAGDAWLERLVARVAGGREQVRRAYVYRGVREENPYQRVVELWFDDRAAWRAAVVGDALAEAAPWGGDLFALDIRSAFIGERPDLNFLTRELATP
jgi:hypothetical protein